MEVNHDAHAKRLGAEGFFQDILSAVVAIRRINPDTITDCIEAKFLHQHRTFALLTRSVVERIALRLHLRHPTDIGTLGKGWRSLLSSVSRLDWLFRFVRIARSTHAAEEQQRRKREIPHRPTVYKQLKNKVP